MTNRNKMTLETRISEVCSLSDIPKFGELISNVTASVGREATLACVVDDLATYKVGLQLPVFFINY
jgi:hypothetical protein